jgi:iron complex transport system ATP-binding protein
MAVSSVVSIDSPDAGHPDGQLSVEIEGLSFAYGRGGHRLVDVSLELRAGEVCCLLGPNGAGKTTLLRCILGLLKPAGGVIRVAGRDVTHVSARQLARLVAYVPQSTTTPFPFTALEMVVMGRTPHVGATAAPSAADRRAAVTQLERLDVAHLAHRSFPLLSGGERQLILLARALVQQAPVLILDEPTASLDYGNEVRFLDILADLVSDNRTVLMTTHQPAHALTHADRAVLMREGTIMADGPCENILTSERLTELYGVRIHVAQVPLPGTAGETQLTCFPIRPRRNPRPQQRDTSREEKTDKEARDGQGSRRH